MGKTILLTGATDGIGLETAKALVSAGHHVLLHGRNPEKLADVESTLARLPGSGSIESHVADLSNMADVAALADAVGAAHAKLDVLINNAGILKSQSPVTKDGLDIRIVVNTLAPYLLTKKLLPKMDASSRVVNLSSAAQAPVDLDGLAGRRQYSDDMSAYAQSKLAITMWTVSMAQSLGENGPMVVAVNPGSLLGTKMVKEGFGTAGNDINIGVDILCRAALSDEFNDASGRYFDNDARRFNDPHPDALDYEKCDVVTGTVEVVLNGLSGVK